MNHHLKGGMSGDVVNERKPLVGLFDLSVYYAITSFSILSGLLGVFFLLRIHRVVSKGLLP